MDKSPFDNQFFKGKHFTTQKQVGSDVSDCVFDNCFFEALEIVATFSFCEFINCQFKNVNFYWSLMHDNKFIDCHFTKTSFSGVTLKGSKFLDCDFQSAIFKPSNLGGGCDLRGVVIRDCKAGKFISYNSQFDEDDEISSLLVRKTIKELSLNKLNKLSFDS